MKPCKIKVEDQDIQPVLIKSPSIQSAQRRGGFHISKEISSKYIQAGHPLSKSPSLSKRHLKGAKSRVEVRPSVDIGKFFQQ